MQHSTISKTVLGPWVLESCINGPLSKSQGHLQWSCHVSESGTSGRGWTGCNSMKKKYTYYTVGTSVIQIAVSNGTVALSTGSWLLLLIYPCQGAGHDLVLSVVDCSSHPAHRQDNACV